MARAIPSRIARARIRRQRVGGAVAEGALDDHPLRPGQERLDLGGQRVIARHQHHRHPVVAEPDRR